MQSPEKHVPGSAHFRVVGDILVHQRQLDCALRPDGSYDFRPQFSQMRELLKGADYTIANLETTIGMVGGLPYSGYPRFNTPEALLDALRDAGVDFLSLANNHILDRGSEGMRKTADRVKAWGFDFDGVSLAPEERPVIVELGGIRVGLLSYTEIINIENSSETWPQAVERGAALGVKTLQHANFSADVRRLRNAGAELVFALPHWGMEYQRTPEEETVALAKKMIAAGIDVILGSHPHVVRPVEYLEAETDRGETRTGLVAYSLGNFISSQSRRYTDAGIILDFTVCRLADGSYSVKDVHIIPTYCWRSDNMIQPLCSKRYLKEAPEGMDGAAWQSLKESYEELRELLGDTFPLTAC